ncbi:MAG: SDR family oxidoreductase [Thermoguttaceae bacterium]|jgi:NAD(P)-dependent dehydrogenase (short-subunit alcohol dehydrogenase family)
MSAAVAGSQAIVVTGASTGIGEACVRELDKRGFRVFAGVRSEADAQRLEARGTSRLTALRFDVTDTAAIAAAARDVTQSVGAAGLWGLVNNAGIAVAGPMEALPLDLLRRQMEVNFIGQVAVTQAFLPLLRLARGRIVNMSSINGRVSAPYLGPYAASKHALEGMTDALRSELRSWGIQVILVEPAGIATPIWKKSFSATTRLTAELPEEVVALYDADLKAIERLAPRLIASALPVEKVVRAVLHALTARRPKTRYPVGWKSHLAFTAKRWLSTRLIDRILRQQMGLPK